MRSRNIPIPLMMKVADREERKPSALVMARPVNEKKRRSQFAAELTRNSVHHSSRVNNRIEPKSPRHLFFREVSPGHMDHDFPVRFHKAIGRLTASGGGNDVGIIIEKMFPNLCPEEFRIAITPETPSIGTSISPKQTESSQNGRAGEIFEPKDPIVTCGAVNENEGVSEPTCGNTVAERNVNMNNVEVEGLFTINCPTPRSLRDCCKRAE